MTDITQFLKELISAPGLSGHEGPARELINREWKPLVDQTSVSRLGSLHGLKKGTGREPRPSILLAAHMDAIGLMVTGISQGFVRFTRVGGVDPRILLGQPVVVHGVEDLPGIVVQPGPRLLPPEYSDKPVPMDYLLVDVGLRHEEAIKLIRTGDLISFGQMPFDLSGEVLTGHTLDDRAAVAAVTYCLELLQKRIHIWDVWAVATVQEEVTFGGSFTSTFGIKPDLGIAIDVTHAKGPGTSDPGIPPLGKGFTLDIGPNTHPNLYKSLKKLADELEIPYHTTAYPHHSGTDAYAIQVTEAGIPSMVLSIPLRYMHTPVETISIKDIKRAGRLLAEFITALDADYLDHVRWDD